MYCNVYTTGNGNVIYINPNCNMKLIYEYLRVVTEVPDSKEVDLCTESGRLLGIYEAPCTASGLSYFKPRANYFIMTFDYVEGSGELLNPHTLMDFNDHDFTPVFGRMKNNFGIPPTEVIDESDASLIFEHVLLAYQGNLQQLSEVDVTKKRSLVTSKKKPQSFTQKHSTTSMKKRTSKHLASFDGKLENNVLAQWREEKRAKLIASTAEEEEENVMQGRGSLAQTSVEDDLKNEEIRAAEEAIAEEQLGNQYHSKKAKDSQKTAHQTKDKKAAKKNPKKSVKEDAQLQQTAPNISKASLTSKPSFRSIHGQSMLQLFAPQNSSKSVPSFVPTSDYCDPTKSTLPVPHNSIRKFFRDHPNDLTSLPKPPAIYSNPEVPEKPLKKIRKKKKLARSKTKKVIVTRPSCAKLRKRPHKLC